MLAKVHQPIRHSAALSVLADQLGGLDVQLQEELAHCGVLTVKLDREVEIWIGLDRRDRQSASGTSTKVLVILEPPDIRQFDLDGFDLVLTWQEEHLRKVPQARLFVPATPWLTAAEWPAFRGSAKRSCLGFLRGSKTRTEGHRLRHEIWAMRSRLQAGMNIGVDFCEGGVSRDDRNQQFLNRFVLVIENSRHANYFTEKLLDAMLSGCIPVYWGCPNIGDFFDARGLVEVQGGAEEVAAACSQLAEACHEGRAEALERNFALATEYAGDFGQRLQRALEQCLPSLEGSSGRPCEGVEPAT